MTAITGSAQVASAERGREVRWDQWDDPADAQCTWHFDLTHFPDVMTPLGYDLYMQPFMKGFEVGMIEHGEGGAFQSRRVNGYLFMYHRAGPKAPAPPSPDERLAKLSGAGARWRDELLPEIQGLIDHYRVTDFDSLSDAALAHEIETLRERRVRAGVLHTLALRPWSQAMNLLVDTYKELTGGDGVQAARLVQGYGNKSVEAGHALWRLSQLAASLPELRARLARVDSKNAREVLRDIETDGAAASFVAALREFLDEFGWRSDLFELAEPSWAEDPTIALCQLRAYLQMEDYDPDGDLARLAAERETLVQETLAALKPAPRARLERVLAAVRDVVTLQEDHNFYIDQRLALLPRRLVVAAARRMVGQGWLTGEGDVFYLHAAELTAALERRDTDGLAALVQRRKDEMARWAAVTPPEFIGAPPEPAKTAPAAGVTGESSAGAMDGDGAVVLTGNGGSAGVARGPARILHTLSEADKLHPGDVLVARTTMPPWTPLFAVASAMVVEVGGVLSHPAVTAREYGLPAVLNVRDATNKIRDGQIVEVDGTRGRVRLLS